MNQFKKALDAVRNMVSANGFSEVVIVRRPMDNSIEVSKRNGNKVLIMVEGDFISFRLNNKKFNFGMVEDADTIMKLDFMIYQATMNKKEISHAA